MLYRYKFVLLQFGNISRAGNTTRKKKETDMNNMPTITKNLLIINILVFAADYILKTKYGIDLDSWFGLHFILSSDFQLWQPFTYMFMHGGFDHIFFNMFAVWMFGRILEQVWGSKRFLFYYLACGVGAGVCQELLMLTEYARLTSLMQPEAITQVLQEGSSVLQMNMNYIDNRMASLNLAINLPTVGASGAIYGILLAFGMLFPNEQMFVFPLPVPIKAKYFVVGYAVIELLLGLANRPGDSIAHFAHLGGMLFGFLLIMYWKKKKRNEYYY